MSVNIVQLQRGMSIPEFMKQYGTEDKCISALESQRWPNGFTCPIMWKQKLLHTENKKIISM